MSYVVVDTDVVLPCTFHAATWGRDSDPRPAPWASSADQRLVDRRLLPRPRTSLATFDIKNYADFTEHEGLELVL